MNKVNIIILAGGKGTRLKAKNIPKVMFLVQGKPIIGRIIERFSRFESAEKIVVVVGFKGQKIIDYVNSQFQPAISNLQFVWQKHQLGTGHALKIGLQAIKENTFPTAVFSGDHPHFLPRTIERLAKIYQREKPTMVIITAERRGKSSFGRVVTDKRGLVREVVEVKDCSPAQLRIKTINVGAYLFNTHWLRQNISKLRKNPVTQEYYATDLIGLAVSQGKKILTAQVTRPAEAMGVNTAEDLKKAEQIRGLDV